MNIIAFDLGSKCGYAARINEQVHSGTMDLAPARSRKHEGGGMRYMRFRNNLTLDLLTNVDLVVYEEVRRHMGVDAAHVYGGMLATLTSCCEQRIPPVPYESVSVQEIKKFATGKGNAGKEEVMAAIRILGFNPVDDNEADAIALLYYKLNQLENT